MIYIQDVSKAGPVLIFWRLVAIILSGSDVIIIISYSDRILSFDLILKMMQDCASVLTPSSLKAEAWSTSKSCVY
jgi:hypothetical protein